MAVPFFAVAGFVLATGLMLAPHAFLGSIPGNFEARASSNSPAAVTSLSWGVDAKTGAVVGATAGAIKKNKDDIKDEKKDE